VRKRVLPFRFQGNRDRARSEAGNLTENSMNDSPLRGRKESIIVLV